MKRAVLLSICGVWAGVAAAEARLADGVCALRFARGALVVSDRTGADVLAVGRLSFGWGNPQRAEPISAVASNGALVVAYRLDNDVSNAVRRLDAVATLTGHGFRLDFTGDFAASVKSGGQMLDVVRLNGTVRDQTVMKCGFWVRCKPAVAAGYFDPGVPFEVKSRNLKPYTAASGQVFWCCNTGWSGARTECPGFGRTPDADGLFRARLEFVSGVHATDAQVAAAEVDGRPFVLRLSTDRPFNLFEDGAPSFSLRVDPLVTGRRTLRVCVRDFDGCIVLERRAAIDFVRGQPRGHRFTLPPLPSGARGIWFVEASLADGDREEGFVRTNLAVLPPHDFRHRATSIAGMAAYPEGADAERLLARLGVAILRYGDNRHFQKEYGITAYAARHAPPEVFDAANARHRQILDEEIVGRIRAQGAPVFEFGNEVGWRQPPEEQARLVTCYVSWLKAIRARLNAEGLGHVKIITFGLQPDYSADMMARLKDAGAFDLVDGLTLHPGRGYYTADWTRGGWVFRGIIQRARARFAALGYPDKEIHLTECYAATHPNDGWKDSPRQAAENVALSLAVAAAEPRVKNMMFYKLHQGTSQDPHGYPVAHPSGTSTLNAEYDFGLLMRDDSPKPSLLAYAATCERLDGARFVRERGESAGGTLRGFAFETPESPLALLFDRTEGGQQYRLWLNGLPKAVRALPNDRRDALFRHKEAWVRHWTAKRDYSFKVARGGRVRVFDVIGRERAPDVRNGRLRLALDGEPVFVYGLDLADVFPATARAGEASASDFDYHTEENSGAKICD